MAETGYTMLYALAQHDRKSTDLSKPRLKSLPPLLGYTDSGALETDARALDSITRFFRIRKQDKRPNVYTLTGAKVAARELHPVDMVHYGKCTMVLTVYSRHRYLLDRLAWYTGFAYLKSIVVVWNKVTEKPPTLEPTWFRIPVTILTQRANSMNNRFRPSPYVDTDCVINMDDDWDMPYPVMEYAVRVWHAGYQDELVGLSNNGRVHGKGIVGSSASNGARSSRPTWKYSSSMVKGKGVRSIVLPSGMVYHRRYLALYTERIPAEARALVDDVMNCDDILFNFMVANSTKHAPVFIGTDAVARVRPCARTSS